MTFRRWPAWGKTLVFAVTRRHAETLAEMFDEHFADLKPHPATRYADFVVSDVGGGPAPDASAIVKRFKEEEYPRILVSVNMLDTGFDCPEAVNLVMARFTRSSILYRQMRGRQFAPNPARRDPPFEVVLCIEARDLARVGVRLPIKEPYFLAVRQENERHPELSRVVPALILRCDGIYAGAFGLKHGHRSALPVAEDVVGLRPVRQRVFEKDA